MKRWLKFSLSFVALSFTVAAATALYAYQQAQAALTAPFAVEQPIELEIKQGQSLRKLMTQWQQNGWVSSELWLRLSLKMKPELGAIKAGNYQINQGEQVAQVLEKLSRGDVMQFSVTLVEGGTVAQWLQQLAQHPRINATIDSPKALATALGIEQDNPEGWFYPDTYAFNNGATDLSVMQRAYATMKAKLDQSWQQRFDKLPLKDAYDLLILASIIEKETAVAAERGQVASVFVNRLNRKMRLQTDPTVIYGLGDSYAGDITRKHLRDYTPYNTYRIDGLTPTPIANPSEASLLAAAQPETTDYLYFVANGEGGHTFSKTLTEHNRAVRRYIKIQKQQ